MLPMTSLPIEIIRSPRRKRTLQAAVVDGTIRVRVPAGMARDEEKRLVDQLVAKVRRKLEVSGGRPRREAFPARTPLSLAGADLDLLD